MDENPNQTEAAPVRVRAKFRCDGVKNIVAEDPAAGQSIALNAVYDSNAESENGRFFKLTPCGQINLSTVNPAASAAFIPGKEYYVDFTPAN